MNSIRRIGLLFVVILAAGCAPVEGKGNIPSPSASKETCSGAGCAFIHLTSTHPAKPTATRTPIQTRLPSLTPTATRTSTIAATVLPIYPGVTVDESVDLQYLRPKQPFILHFDLPVIPPKSLPALLTYPYTEGIETWSADRTTLTFLPAAALTPGAQYVFQLNNDLRLSTGDGGAGSPAWNIQVADAPQIQSISPKAGELTSRNPEFTIVFSRPMDAESIRQAIHFQPDVPYQASVSADWVKLTVSEPINPGQQFRLLLAGSAADTDGIPLGKEEAWTFSIAPLFASDREVKTTPKNLILQFNFPLDPDSAEQALQIDPPLPGVRTWTSNYSGLTISPSAPLAEGRIIRVSFRDSLKDANGDAITSQPTTSFYTGLPFTITAVPEPGRKYGTAGIELAFTRPVDHRSVEQAIRITPASGLVFSWSGETLTIQPDTGGWAGEYRLAMTTAARDAVGQPFLEDEYSYGFYNEPQRGIVFGEGGDNIQLLDADGRRQVVFNSQTDIGFTLYRLPLRDFLAAYQAHPNRNYYGVTVPKAAGWPAARVIPADEVVVMDGQLQIPADVPVGLYLLAGHTPAYEDDLFLIISHNDLTAKKSAGQVVIWANDINGPPLSGVQTSLYDSKGNVIGGGVTNSKGLAAIRLAGGAKPAFVVAQAGSDITLTGLSADWRKTSYYSGIPYGTSQSYAVYSYTDRPIYQPGQKVYFKSVLRVDNDAAYVLPAQESPVTIRINDPRGNLLQTQTLRTNPFGTVNGDYPLPQECMLGAYQLEVEARGEIHTQTFQVEEYRKPEVRVQVDTDAESYVAGQEIRVSVHAEYYSGRPAAIEKVRYSFFSVDNYWGYWEPVESEFSPKPTDPDGNLEFTIHAPSSTEESSWRWRERSRTYSMEITVADGLGSRTIRVYPASEQMTLAPSGFVHGLDLPAFYEVTVSEIGDGRPVKDREVTLKAERGEQVTTKTAATDASGKVKLEFHPAEGGFYSITLSSVDTLGNEYSVSDWAYFTDSSKSFWSSEGKIQLFTDRDTYSAGDTAQVTILSAVEGQALLTVERGTVRSRRLVTLKAGNNAITLPITPDMSPNVFLTVHLWAPTDAAVDERAYYEGTVSDSKLYTHTVQIRVPSNDKQLNLSIKSDKAVYAPGETAEFTVRVSDPAGKPVWTELSLALVDEALFGLADDPAADIFNAFYSPRPLSVWTYDSYEPWRILYVGGRGGGGGDGGGGGVRSQFPDVAAWYPAVTTNGKGEAAIQVRLPDTLTAWRLTVKGVTKDTRVGQAAYSVQVQKPLTVQFSLPGVLTMGDAATLTARVANYTETSAQARVELFAEGLTVAGPPAQTVDLAPGEMKNVSWKVIVTSASSLPVVVRAQTDSFEDAMQLPLKVRPLERTVQTSQAGRMEGEGALTFRVLSGSTEGSEVRLQISRNPVSGILDGLEYLIGYPYGCVEQTMSRALPDAVVARTFRKLGIPFPGQDSLAEMLRQAIVKLYAFQHSDGGWGWWVDDASDDYQTAWVVFGLQVMSEGGAEVDPLVIQRGVDYLQEMLPDLDDRTKAFSLYSMAYAGSPDLEATLALAAKSDGLDTFSRAALALALEKAGRHDRALGLLESLSADAASAGGVVWWEEQDLDGEYHRKTMASTIRSTALVLEAYLVIDPQARLGNGQEVTAAVAAWLQTQRRFDGWGTTNETAFAILALSDFLTTMKRATAPMDIQWSLNGAAGGSLPLEDPAFSGTIIIPRNQMRDGINLIRMAPGSSGAFYYLLSEAMTLPEKDTQPAGVLTVEREYRHESLNKPITSVQKGQVVRVVLKVTVPRAGYYLLLEDPLPGGFEALNERLNTVSRSYMWQDDSYLWERFYWQEYGYNNKEIHPDRVSFFITTWSGGSHTITYLARATTEGEFYAPPATAYAMYNPAEWGASSGKTISILPEK